MTQTNTSIYSQFWVCCHSESNFQFVYRTETIAGTAMHKAIMKLSINDVQRSDYGTYKCVAKNPRGETDGTIRLYCK